MVLQVWLRQADKPQKCLLFTSQHDNHSGDICDVNYKLLVPDIVSILRKGTISLKEHAASDTVW